MADRLDQSETRAEVILADQKLACEKGQADWVDQALQARWLVDGDRCTKLFYKNFKSLAASKQIPVLIDDQGQTASSWEEMADVVRNYFIKGLGECAPPPSTQAALDQWEETLEPLSDTLTPGEKARLNAPLSIQELGEAARCMPKLKCPGADGIPVEFFQQAWTLVGPLLLQVLNNGMQRGAFPRDITRGLIVLLPKKNDQRLLTNKRPITLLSVAYKIGAKAMQKRLTPILQRIITPQQSAFLPGRNIHHSILLLGEMLQQAEASGEDHILLKFDVIKAFDRLEWPFLLEVLRRIGVEGMLTDFLEASFASASSAVLLNGIPTPEFALKRSVRQGCPLSPLLFIIAFDTLNHLLLKAQSNETIVGVYFPGPDIYNLQNSFADDLAMVIRTILEYIHELQRILETFGAASGLHCDWNKTVAAFIPAGPHLPVLDPYRGPGRKTTTLPLCWAYPLLKPSLWNVLKLICLSNWTKNYSNFAIAIYPLLLESLLRTA